MTDLPVLSVTELTRQIKDAVEADFPAVAVVGEISNLTRASSGHVYLTLKDDNAQLRACMWRSAAARVKFDLTDGLEVVALGRVELYQARGSLQLIVERLIPQGMGALELAFRQLQEKLAAEGLFDPERKRQLPFLPRRIALVTSPTSAAVRDLLQVIVRRWPAANVIVVPVAVQGDGAAQEIADGLRTAATIPDVDVIITGRGGGSLEDLWAFNEEVVARAIYASPIPVVSAVGHEIDVSIADLVADRRALTPSEAGEIVVPLHSELAGTLESLQQRLTAGLRARAATARARLEALASRRVLAEPRNLVYDRARLVDEFDRRLKLAVANRISVVRQELNVLGSSLHALSPLRVFDRGYSVTQEAANNRIVRQINEVEIGELIKTRVADGEIVSRVESKTEVPTSRPDSENE